MSEHFSLCVSASPDLLDILCDLAKAICEKSHERPVTAEVQDLTPVPVEIKRPEETPSDIVPPINTRPVSPWFSANTSALNQRRILFFFYKVSN